MNSTTRSVRFDRPAHSSRSPRSSRIRLRAAVTFAAVTAMLAAVALFGCSKSSSPTNPYGGGNTGGSGNAAFDSGTLGAPATYTHTFPSAGAVGYHCRFHVSMGMTGTVTVADGAADSAVVTASGTSFAPSSVTIKPGGMVRWNVTSGTHTVTSD